MVVGRDGDEAFRSARLAIDGYEKVTPLEAGERAIIGELLARADVRRDRRPGLAQRAVRGSGGAPGRAPRRGARRPSGCSTPPAGTRSGDSSAAASRERAGPSRTLADRRQRALGPAMTGLSYREPLHLVRGEGAWLIDADGRRYLDAYNNVPVVGHGHPRVVEAVVRQARRLNTNMRYLHETALEVAERLVASTAASWTS